MEPLNPRSRGWRQRWGRGATFEERRAVKEIDSEKRQNCFSSKQILCVGTKARRNEEDKAECESEGTSRIAVGLVLSLLRSPSIKPSHLKQSRLSIPSS